MKNFFKKLISEFSYNGKSLLVWVLNEIPGITDYPGLREALDKYLADPNQNNLWHLIFQAAWAGASGHRLLKILVKLLRK